jgi:hypothetical protein
MLISLLIHIIKNLYLIRAYTLVSFHCQIDFFLKPDFLKINLNEPIRPLSSNIIIIIYNYMGKYFASIGIENKIKFNETVLLLSIQVIK